MELYPLLAGESIEVRTRNIHLPPDDPKAWRSHFFPSWGAADEFATENELDYDIYFGVAPRVPDENGNLAGKAKNVSRCPLVWLDLDAKEGFSKQDRLDQLANAQPSVLVDSGNGFHGYWILDRDLDPADAKRVMQEMAAHFQCDLTADSSRVLRWPGTRNHKDPDKLLFVTTLIEQPEARWNPEALPRASVPDSALANGSSPKRIALIEEHGVSEHGSEIEGEWFEGRDKAMFDVACNYFHQHWDKADVLDRLIVVNEKNQPPLSLQALKDKVNRVFTYDAAPNIIEVQEAPQIAKLKVSGPFEMVSIHDLPEPTKPKYLWNPYFLLNRLVLLDGEEGIGKGLLLCYLASQYSDEHPFAWFTAEDDPVDDVNPRVRAVRTFFGVSPKTELNIFFNNGKKDPRFNEDNDALFDQLEATIEKYGTKVLVLDPGRSFIGPKQGQKDFSYNNEADVRGTMQKFMRISREHEVAIIFVHHFNKNAQASLRHRTTGTGAWRQVVRQQVTMLWDYKMDDGVFGVQKSNIGATGSIRAYRKEIVDAWAVFNPSDTIDPIPELQQWADHRAKTTSAAIQVIDPEIVVNQVRDWAADALNPGDPFPSRAEVMKLVGLNQTSATSAIKGLRDEEWLLRAKGQRGGGYIWQPPEWWLSGKPYDDGEEEL